MAKVFKYMSHLPSKEKCEKYILDVTYHSKISTKLDLIKALKCCGAEIKAGWIKSSVITVTDVTTGIKQQFTYGVDFTSKIVNYFEF